MSLLNNIGEVEQIFGVEDEFLDADFLPCQLVANGFYVEDDNFVRLCAQIADSYEVLAVRRETFAPKSCSADWSWSPKRDLALATDLQVAVVGEDFLFSRPFQAHPASSRCLYSRGDGILELAIPLLRAPKIVLVTYEVVSLS